MVEREDRETLLVASSDSPQDRHIHTDIEESACMDGGGGFRWFSRKRDTKLYTLGV
jgi:hypothetical protein